MIKYLLSLLLICTIVSISYGQSSNITGVVIDADAGTPIPSVNIVVKGTTMGTVSDFDGNFSISASNGDVLLFSSIGFESMEVALSASSAIRVSLKPTASELDEIILVGYTSRKKSNVTSSVSVVDASELADVTTPDVSTMLQSKAAGVQVVQSSGQPGEVPSIQIRGVTTLNGSTSPLWVVDGIIMPGTPNLGPFDIETISVLKDASATALYGSRGANGVIVVSTKEGSSGKNEITISSRTGFAQFNNGNFELMNSQQLFGYYQKFGNPTSIPEEINESLLNTNYDWFKNGTKTGFVQDHNISFSGGTDKSKTFISLGYYKESGTLKDFDYDRLNFRLNHNYKVGEKLTLKPRISMNYNKRSNRQAPLYSLYTYLPWDKPYDDQGNIINPQAENNTTPWYGRDQDNYLYDLQYNYDKSRELNLYTTFNFEYDVAPHLKFISTNGITLFYADGTSYIDPNSNAGLANIGSLYKYNEKRYTNFTNQMFKYSNAFGDHAVNALIAYEFNNNKYEGNNGTGYGLVPGTTILDNAARPAAVGGTTNDEALQGILFNFDYSYSNRYLAQFSVRRDGASNFGKENKYGTFYSGSVGWNIHNEAFFKVDAINSLKLRASYGAVGNRPGALYPQYDLYSLGNTYNAAPAPTPSQLGNSDLSWEISYQTNIGVDMRLLDRIDFSFEYYDKNTSDLLYFVQLPSVTGYTGYYENIGAVTNKGFESSIFVDVFKGNRDNFNWTLSANIGANKNEVKELFEDKDINRGTKISRVGEDFNSWYMRKWTGVDPANGSPLWEVVDPQTGARSKTSDYNAATNQIVGTSSPDFYGGFTTDMNFKGFSLSANFGFVSGNKIYNSSRELYDADGAYPTFNQQVLLSKWNRWENAGDVATHPLPIYGGNNASNKTSSRYIEDGSYLRLRNVRFGYSLPPNWIEKMGFTNFELYLTGDNLLTFTGYSGTDPEAGIDGFIGTQYPISRRFAIGINLSL